MTRRLIVNADDLGLTPGVNQGILEAHQRGILTSTTAMVNMPAAEMGLQLLQREAPQVGIGLHINLTTGPSVLPAQQVPSLVQADGTFYYNSDNPLERASQMQPGEIEAEIRAQFERFIHLAGRKPDHLDAHHHAAYHIPAAFETLLDLARAHDLPIRRAFSWLTDSSFDEPRYDTLREMLTNAPLPRTTDQFETGFYGSSATLENLTAIFSALPDGTTELMCHPGYRAGIEQKYAAPREVELAVLTDPSVRALIDAQGIELIAFGEL